MKNKTIKIISVYTLLTNFLFCTHATIEENYIYHLNRSSDIQEHLETLHDLAYNCSTIIEIGLRDMVSSWALLYGLSKNGSAVKKYIGIDIVPPPIQTLTTAQKLAQDSGIDFSFWQKNDMTIHIPEVELLFIDSLHTYVHLTYELEKFSKQVTKYIAMHDTSAPWGETNDTEYHGDYSEYPNFIDRSKKGLWPAVVDFLQRHPEWILEKRHLNCHGFTILKRVQH